MKYLWFPRWYQAVCLLLILNLSSLAYHRRNEFAAHAANTAVEVRPITDYFTFRAAIVLAVVVVIGLIWGIVGGWSQQIVRKTRRPGVDVTNVDRAYGGTVVGSRVPGRVWDTAGEGDMLVKPAGSLFVRLEPRRRAT